MQLSCHPEAVVILRVHKYKKKVTRKFKSGGLHKKHVLATWKLGNHLSIRLQTQGKQDYLIFFDTALQRLIEINLNTNIVQVHKSCTLTKLQPDEIRDSYFQDISNCRPYLEVTCSLQNFRIKHPNAILHSNKLHSQCNNRDYYVSLCGTGYSMVSDYNCTLVVLSSANATQTMKRFALMHGQPALKLPDQLMKQETMTYERNI